MTPAWWTWFIIGGPVIGAAAGGLVVWVLMLRRLDRIRDDIWQDGFDQGRYNLAGEEVQPGPQDTILVSLHPHQPKHGTAPVATLAEWTAAANTAIRQEFAEIREHLARESVETERMAPWPGFSEPAELDHGPG